MQGASHLPCSLQVVALRDVARPTDLLQFNDLYIVMDLMPMDLSRVINCDPPEVITANHIQVSVVLALLSLEYFLRECLLSMRERQCVRAAVCLE